jgi:hypothetical protein
MAKVISASILIAEKTGSDNQTGDKLEVLAFNINGRVAEIKRFGVFGRAFVLETRLESVLR